MPCGGGAASAPPTRPEGYSTSDSEANRLGWFFSKEEEEAAADEVVEDIAAGKEWQGFTLEYEHGSDADEDAAE
ncbi:Os11g0297500 [Oryza sativa Japonica Group]|uniref:Uncharacterized protein n=2 Tax=Oryza sativa subsp. japonica TaxID=39947 RepID=A0A8J8XKE3_ORYSJ|nr:hypothetical protein LOC_Os11g19180 [Oryza sativa Japonica Group]ABA92793.1 hypothetical protein LOC_Os11g19180 [Oryza sativa Japonica Group]EAZ18143.1 hypothetical protein OsJ_33693 [Oryza sativa Japonica Group]BAT13667.1 Os11g0297500 [Oryza sativa Japonica Group]